MVAEVPDKENLNHEKNDRSISKVSVEENVVDKDASGFDLRKDGLAQWLKI